MREIDAPLTVEDTALTLDLYMPTRVDVAASRYGRRERFGNLNEVFSVLLIHDVAHQELVRAWGRAFVTNPAYKRAFNFTDSFVPDGYPDLDAALAADDKLVSAWMPPTGGYVAIGGRVMTAAQEVTDGERIAARISRTRIEVVALSIGRDEVPASTVDFPEVRRLERAEAGHQRRTMPCSRCGLTLPATGVCDNCDT